MPVNYAAESEIRTACANAGVLSTAIDDFIVDFQNYKFGRDEIAKYIDQCRETKPHRFAAQSDDDLRLFNQAFGSAPNLTAQTHIVKQYGIERAREVAALFGTTVGSAKPGTAPDSMKLKGPEGDHSRNPWNPAHVGRDGRFTARAMTLQSNLVKAIGLERASQIAAVFGCRVGDVRPPKAA
jgi:hypothetical protein